MKRNRMLLILAICVIAFSGILLGLQTATAETGDIFFLSADHPYFDFNTMKPVYSGSKEADLRFGCSGSAWYFQPYNDASIIDLGVVNYEEASAPGSGYSSERVRVKQDHVYAVRCGNGSYGIIVVTDYNNEGGIAKFKARLVEPEKRLDLHYLSGDSIRFDLETMQNAPGSHDSDIYFRYFKTALVGENGASIKDLGVIDYESAKAPRFGYLTDDVKVTKDHVYAVQCGSKGFYLIKVTNVLNESDIEFTARTAELESTVPTAQQGNKTTLPDQETEIENSLISPAAGRENAPSNDASAIIKENNGNISDAPNNIISNENRESDIKGEIQGGKYLYNGKVLLEIHGTLDWACISPNEKYVAYRDGQEINYYDIEKKKHISLYRLTTDEYMGKYVVNYGLTSPTHYDFVRWSEDSKFIVVKRWTTDMFKGGSGNYQINIADKTMTFLSK